MLITLYYLVILATGNPLVLPMPNPDACKAYKAIVEEQGFEAQCAQKVERFL